MFMKQSHVDCTGKVKYSAILSILYILHMSLITCSNEFRHQIDVASYSSCTYCLNPYENRILSLHPRVLSSSLQITINAGKVIL